MEKTSKAVIEGKKYTIDENTEAKSMPLTGFSMTMNDSVIIDLWADKENLEKLQKYLKVGK